MPCLDILDNPTLQTCNLEFDSKYVTKKEIINSHTREHCIWQRVMYPEYISKKQNIIKQLNNPSREGREENRDFSKDVSQMAEQTLKMSNIFRHQENAN